MSRLFCAVRFGAFVAWLVLLMGTLLPAGPAQAQATALVATVKVGTKQAIYSVALAAYSPVEASGGVAPYRYRVAPALPAGLLLDVATGAISGTPTVVTAAADYTMIVTDDAGATADAVFRLEVTKRTQPITLTATPNPAQAGATVTLRADLGTTEPTGKIKFYRNGLVGTIGEVELNGGVATLDVTNLPNGEVTVTAVYEGDTNFNNTQRSTKVTITLAQGQIALRSNKAWVNAGQSVILTATVTPNTVTGQVVFKDNGADIKAVNIVNGVATFTTDGLAAGNHSFTAEFQGNATYDVMVSNGVDVEVFVATLTPTKLELAIDKAQVSLNERATFTATLKIAATGAVATAATGTIRFLEAGQEVGIGTLTAGVATLPVSTFGQGQHSIIAEYAGDTTYGASRSGTVSVTVVDDGKVATTSALTASKTQATPGETITFTATVTPTNATGAFTLWDQADGQGAIVVRTLTAINGQATFNINSLARGGHRLYVTFAPQGNFTTSTSGSVNVTIADAGTKPNTNTNTGATGTATSTTTLTASKTQATYREIITFTVRVAPPEATGNVALRDGTNVRHRGPLDKGVATFTLSDLTPGDHQMNAVYEGSDVHAASTSQNVTVTIDKEEGRIVIATQPATPSVGQTFELRASIIPSYATGNVTFKENGQDIGTARISNGVATLRITNAVLGDHTYSASYSGDGRVKPVDSADTLITVSATKPSPLNDPSVRALVSAQLSTAKRMTHDHIGAVHLRLETLHEDDVPAFSNGLQFSQAGNLPSAARSYEEDNWVRTASETPASRSIDNVLQRDRFKPVSTKEEELVLPRLTRPNGFHVWTAGSVMFGGVTFSGLGSGTKTNFTMSAVTAGIDAKIGDGLRAGFAASYSAESSDLGKSLGDFKANMVAGSLYGSWRMNRNFFLDAMLGYGMANFTSNRKDMNLLMTMPGSRKGQMMIASVGISYDEKSGKLKYSPYGRLDTVSINLGRYSEEGDVSWSIVYQSMRTTAQSLVLGLRAEYDYDYRWGVLTPFTRVEYRHALTVAGVQSLGFAGDGGSTYTVSPASTGSDTLTGSLGLRAVDRKSLSGTLEYSMMGGQGGLVGQGLRGAMRVGF